jgi:uncharacterized membrane protein
MKKEKPLDKATRAIAWFMGSWWGVLTHVIWFSAWIIFGFSVEYLTFWVSLEAIFIGIFLLMAANQSEKDRDRRDARERAKEIQQVAEDVELDTKAMEELQLIKQMLTTMQSDLNKLKRLREKKAK